VVPPEAHAAPPWRSPFARALDALHLVGLSFFLAAALAGAARGADQAGAAILAFARLLAATAAVAARAARPGDAPRWFRNLHVWWSLVVLPGTFSALRWLVPAAVGVPRPAPVPMPPGRHFDDALAAIDRDWLFGADVARWSEGFLGPGLAASFMVFYALYFLMPVAALGAFLLRRERPYRSLFAVALGLYACYFLYLLVPACGPRHAYVGRSAPLPEGFARWAHDVIRDGEPQPFDAFPSAHVVLGILCAVLSWPIGGWFRWTMALVAAGTAASTVVLRYHYVVDDVVGLAVVAFALGAVRLLDRRIARKSAEADSHGDRMSDLLAGGS
jgi:membrane-associated phospholipid phosphatase